ncbi:unnamed protein product, partial [Mesorhabditis spiculigera]
MRQYFIAALVVAIFVTAVLYLAPATTYSTFSRICTSDGPFGGTTWEAIFEKYRRCMQLHLNLTTPELTWDRGPELAIRDCYKFGPRVIAVANKDELKQLATCKFATFGIGKDATAEEKIKKMLPNCEFYGADPVEDGNKAEYEKVGSFHKLAISGGDMAESSILTKAGYQARQKMPAMPLYRFFDEIVKSKLIDYLFIAVEWAEYDLFEFLQAEKAAGSGFTFCQVNLEVHAAQGDTHKTQFRQFVQQLLRENHYALAHDEMAAGHHRLFFFNQKAEECRRKYLPFS